MYTVSTVVSRSVITKMGKLILKVPIIPRKQNYREMNVFHVFDLWIP